MVSVPVHRGPAWSSPATSGMPAIPVVALNRPELRPELRPSTGRLTATARRSTQQGWVRRMRNDRPSSVGPPPAPLVEAPRSVVALLAPTAEPRWPSDEGGAATPYSSDSTKALPAGPVRYEPNRLAMPFCDEHVRGPAQRFLPPRPRLGCRVRVAVCREDPGEGAESCGALHLEPWRRVTRHDGSRPPHQPTHCTRSTSTRRCSSRIR